MRVGQQLVSNENPYYPSLIRTSLTTCKTETVPISGISLVEEEPCVAKNWETRMKYLNFLHYLMVFTLQEVHAFLPNDLST